MVSENAISRASVNIVSAPSPSGVSGTTHSWFPENGASANTSNSTNGTRTPEAYRARPRGILARHRGRSSMAEFQPSKLAMRVRSRRPLFPVEPPYEGHVAPQGNGGPTYGGRVGTVTDSRADAPIVASDPVRLAALTPDEALRALGSRPDGLTTDEADGLLRREGPNRLPEPERGA